ncbi:Na+/H+ antiporter NhaC [Clostridium sp. Marseille-Q7071]
MSNEIRKPKLLEALLPIIILAICLSVGIILYEASAHIPLVIGSIIASLVALRLGFKWKDLEKGFINSIQMSMQAIIILMIIGIIIGSWILSGTVPTMIYYGLKIISPGIFLLATCIMCSIVSLATGSSWTTVGTVGIALLGIGQGLGFSTPLVAGAVISGAYFGDKMSPLSDTTNLAPAMAGSELFDHIKHMIYTTGPSMIIALVLYGILGLKYAGKELDVTQINTILDGLQRSFNITPLLLIPPVVVIVLVVKKIPAIPGLIAGAILGGLFAILFQSSSFGDIINVMNLGYVGNSGVQMVDELLNRGGLQSMMPTVSLIMCAMTFGGIMEKSGCLGLLAESLLKLAVNTGSLILVTVVSCIFTNLISGDQYLSIVIPGRMYKDEYVKRGLAPKNLSRTLEDAGTMTSCLIPWSNCGAFMSSTLGVPTLSYLPFTFLNLINPLVAIFYGYTGITIEKIKSENVKPEKNSSLNI